MNLRNTGTGEEVSPASGPEAAAAARSREETFLHRFVGREEELAAFARLLDERTDGLRVLALHGPGGIGKTTLLRRFAIEARRRDLDVLEVDAGLVEPTEDAFTAAVQVSGTRRMVLLVDAADAMSHLEGWLRERFLPTLPPGSLVVLAGRRSPSLDWQTDLAWPEALHVRRLGGLSVAESVRLMRDCTGDRVVGRRARIDFCDGHPLALRLVAGDAGAEPGRRWRPSPDVVEELRRRLVDPSLTTVQRRALEICAHAMDTTEDLLRVIMPDDAHAAFEWLRRLPYTLTGRGGLHPMSMVGEVVDRDLRWRAPEAYRAMHKEIRAHAQAAVRSRSEAESLRAAAAFNFAQARGHRFPGFDWGDPHDSVHESPCGVDDTRAVRDLASESLGPEGLSALDFWLHRQPEGFHVYRSARSGDVVGFQGMLRFDRWDAAEVLIDPLVGSVRDHVESHTGLRPGDLVQVVRFMIVRKRAAERPAVLSRMLARVTREVLRQDRLAWSFHVLKDEHRVQLLLEYADFHRLPVTAALSDQGVTLVGHDWRATGVAEWAELLDNQLLSGPGLVEAGRLPHMTVLSRTVFDEAVHDALRTWHQRERFLINPLLQAGFVVDRSDDPEQTLRKLMLRAVEAIDQDPKAKGLKAAVWATYVEGGNTQQAAARQLSVSFSTYRRYLKRGVERVCWNLWEHQMRHAARARSAGTPASPEAPGPGAARE